MSFGICFIFIILAHEVMKPHGESGSEESEGSPFRLMTQGLLPFKILTIILCAVLQLNLVKL